MSDLTEAPHDEVYHLMTDAAAQAARLTTGAVLMGDTRAARMWAIEYAVHRDAKKTTAEGRVLSDLFDERYRKTYNSNWRPAMTVIAA